jgi:hypothetical protein
VRNHQSLIRHLTITAVTLLFLSKVRLDLGGKNPDLTVCPFDSAQGEVPTAADALVASAALCPTCRRGRLRRTAEQIARTQFRNRQAGASHRRDTLARLERLGIDLATLRCCILEGAGFV